MLEGKVRGNGFAFGGLFSSISYGWQIAPICYSSNRKGRKINFGFGYTQRPDLETEAEKNISKINDIETLYKTSKKLPSLTSILTFGDGKTLKDYERKIAKREYLTFLFKHS